MRVLPLVICAVTGFGLCTSAAGNNNLFLPGDAFFPTRLNAEDVDRLKADDKESPIFTYSSLGGYEGAFCGYAGYERAKIISVDGAFVENLKRAYAHVREHYERKELLEMEVAGKKTLRETNGVHVLFYPHKFDFPKFRLGLQYNENWAEEVMKFGHNQRQFRLCCLVDTADGVMESWRDATIVPALKAELPDVEPNAAGITEPVIIRDKVKAFVMDSRPLAKYFDPPADSIEDVSVLSVDSSGTVEISYEEGKWRRTKVEK